MCVFACCELVKHTTADQLTQHTMIKKSKLVLLSVTLWIAYVLW